MASVRCEIVITAPPELVWDVLRDVGAVHQRRGPGARPPARYHHASFEVRPEGAHAARLIWTTDVLPPALADLIRARMERGAAEMKEAIEAAANS